MCGEIAMIATLDRDRFVGRCTCGCVHLIWRDLSLRLLAESVPAARSQFVSLAAPRSGSTVDVWLGDVGLRLRGDEVRDLRGLLDQAAIACALPALVAHGGAEESVGRQVN